jgi:hypothetical protein
MVADYLLICLQCFVCYRCYQTVHYASGICSCRTGQVWSRPVVVRLCFTETQRWCDLCVSVTDTQRLCDLCIGFTNTDTQRSCDLFVYVTDIQRCCDFVCGDVSCDCASWRSRTLVNFPTRAYAERRTLHRRLRYCSCLAASCWCCCCCCCLCLSCLTDLCLYCFVYGPKFIV